MDVLNLYNDISKAADDAIRKTSELIKQSQTLEKIATGVGTAKAVGTVAFHGALGPGFMILDPMEKFVKGEATFRKSAEEFVVSQKKLQLGGELLAKSIDMAGNRWAANSGIISKSVSKLSEVARDWTNTSKMMEDTITALAGKTGFMASAFTDLAHVIKIATGPIGTAILITQTAYSQFVAKWVAESDKLEASMRSVASTFKATSKDGPFDAATIARMSNAYITGGGTRQQFLGMMERAGTYGNISAQNAAQTIEISRIIAKQTGEEQGKVLARYLESVSVLTATKSADEVAKTLREYRLMAGPMEQQGYRGPMARYATYRQDIGRGLSRWSDQYLDIIPSMMFRAGFAPQTTPGQAIRRGIDATGRWAGENLLNLIGRMPSPLAPLQSMMYSGANVANQVGGLFGFRLPQYDVVQPWRTSIGDMAGNFRKGITEAPQRQAAQNVESAALEVNRIKGVLASGKTPGGGSGFYDPLGNPLFVEPAELTPERRENLQRQLFQARQSGLRGTAELIRGRGEAGQKEVASWQEKLDRRKLALEARNIMEEGGGGFEKFDKAAEKIIVAGQKMLKMPENAEKYIKEIETATKDIPESLQKFAQQVNLFDANEVAELQKLMKVPKEVLISGIKRTETELVAAIKKTEGLEDLGLKIKGFGGFPSGAPTMQETSALTLGQLEGIIRADEQRIISLRAQIRALENQPRTSTNILELNKLRTDYEKQRLAMSGLDKDAQEQYDKLMASGKFAEAEQFLAQKESSTIYGQRKTALAGRLSETRALAEPRYQEIQRQQFTTGLQQYRHAGFLTAEELKTIEKEVADSGSLGVTMGSLKLGEVAGPRQRAIQSATWAAQEKLGIGLGGIEAGIARRRGLTGVETPYLTSDKGVLREQAANILNVRKEMYEREIQFTVQYAQARMNVIKTHYDNMNQLEQGRLEQFDRRYAPQIKYGQAVYGAQQGMVTAAMGRYAGEDYWRGQYRGERALREQRLDMMVGLGGGQVPRGIQIMRALRNQREAEENFRRDQARQRENDLRSYQAGANTWDAVRGAVGRYGGNMRDFERSEGGRALQLQILQQNQAAYSRMGIDVSGQIIGLQGQQQALAGRKLAAEMSIRGREGRSIEEQITSMRGDLGGLSGEARQRAEVQLAEKYAEAAKHFNSVGQPEKAARYNQEVERILKDIPPMLKRDFGDAQAKSLKQLEIHTGLLTNIRNILDSTPGGNKKKTGGEVGGGTGTDSGVGYTQNGKNWGSFGDWGGPGQWGGVGSSIVPATKFVGKTPKGWQGVKTSALMRFSEPPQEAVDWANKLGGKLGSAFEPAPWTPDEVRHSTNPDTATYSPEEGVSNQTRTTGYMEDHAQAWEEDQRKRRLKWAQGILSPAEYKRMKARQDEIRQSDEGRRRFRDAAIRRGLPYQETRYGGGASGKVTTVPSYQDPEGKWHSYYDDPRIKQLQKGENPDGSGSEFGSGVTSSPDSQRDSQEQKPEDKMMNAADKMDKAADKLINAEWKVTGPPGYSVTSSGGAGRY